MDNSTDINWTNALKGLSKDDVLRVESCLTLRELGARAPIFTQGEAGDAMFIIQSGRVRMSGLTDAGEEFTYGIWPQGYIIGLISVILDVPRFVSAETIEPSTLLIFPKSALRSCMESIPLFSFNIAYLLALFASDSIRRAPPLALEPVDAKLGRVLVRLAQPEGPDQRYVVRGITQDELGSMVGASRPWVNRALAGFEKRGLIERHKQLIAILDMEACRHLWTD